MDIKIDSAQPLTVGYKKVIHYSRKGVRYVHHEKYYYIPSPPSPMKGTTEILIQIQEGSAEAVDELLRAVDVVLINNGMQAEVNARVVCKEMHGLAPAPVSETDPDLVKVGEGTQTGSEAAPADKAPETADAGADSGVDKGGEDDGTDDVA